MKSIFTSITVLFIALFLGAAAQAEIVARYAPRDTQFSPVDTITMQAGPEGERFALITLVKASSNPAYCEKATGNEFILDTTSPDAQYTFAKVSKAFFVEHPISFIIDGCRFGYPRIVKLNDIDIND